MEKKYNVAIHGENWNATFFVEAENAEAAIDKVRNISLYDHSAVKVDYVDRAEAE